MKNNKYQINIFSPITTLFVWALFLRMLASNRYYLKFPDKQAQVFLIGWGIYIFFSFLVSRMNKFSIWDFKSVFIAIIVLVGTEPLFENDQYRYFWEGKVFAMGESPYRLTPMSPELQNISFDFKEKVGYRELTSPYSPLTVLFFSLFSKLKYKYALLVFQLINVGLIAYFSRVLNKVRTFDALLILGLFTKEFAQSVHMELLALLPFLLSIKCMENKNEVKSSILFLISCLFKLTPLIFASWFVAKSFRENRFSKLYIWVIVLGLIVVINLVGPLRMGSESGLLVYMRKWVWHPGALGIFLAFFSLETSRYLTDLSWLLTLAVLSFSFFKYSWSGHWAALAIFSSTAFFRPAFNPWYTPWFIVSGGWLGSFGSLWYSATANLSYIRYASTSMQYYWLSLFLTHVGFIFTLINLHKYYKKLKTAELV